MIYLLDTNVCIRYLNGSSEGVLRHLNSLRPEEVAVCSVVKAELYFGAMRSTKPVTTQDLQRRFLERFVSLAFDDPAAEAYGRIRAELTSRGTIIGPNDLMIAAIALANNLTLVTHNSEEFGRVPGLRTEDWEAS